MNRRTKKRDLLEKTKSWLQYTPYIYKNPRQFHHIRSSVYSVKEWDTFERLLKGATVKDYKVKGAYKYTNKLGKFSDAFNVASTSMGIFISRDSTPSTGLKGRNASGVKGKCPTGRVQASWLFTNVTEDLNAGLQRAIPQTIRKGLAGLASGLQVQRPNFSTTLLSNND